MCKLRYNLTLIRLFRSFHCMLPSLILVSFLRILSVLTFWNLGTREWFVRNISPRTTNKTCLQESSCCAGPQASSVSWWHAHSECLTMGRTGEDTVFHGEWWCVKIFNFRLWIHTKSAFVDCLKWGLQVINKGKYVKQLWALRYNGPQTGLILLTIGNCYKHVFCTKLLFCWGGGVCTYTSVHVHMCVYIHAYMHPLCGSADELTLNGINPISKLDVPETFFDISEFTLEICFDR